MRFCAHCGAQLPDQAKFCGVCGTSVDAPDEANVFISDEEPQPQPNPYSSRPEKKKGFLHYVWLFLKVLIIAILAVFLLVFLWGVYQGYTSVDDTESGSEQVQSFSGPVSADGDGDGFESIDDLSLQERAEYWEALLDRSYGYLEQERQKGRAADDDEILELILFIEDMHTQLDQLQQ